MSACARALIVRGLRHAALTLALGLGIATSVAAQVQRLALSGGPDGSVPQFVGDGLSTLLSRKIEGIGVSYAASAGSMENLRRVGNAGADFGIVYAGDLYRSMQDPADEITQTTRNVQVISSLYGMPAHLVVRADSGITRVDQLAGRRVVVGAAGSAVAASAQHFFDSLGIWQKINAQFIPPGQGVAALLEGRAEALWIVAELHNTPVTQAGLSGQFSMLPLLDAARQGALLTEHPYYVPVTIAASTYPGIDYDVTTFQDSALWVAGAHVGQDLTYQAVAEVYSSNGLEFMHSVSAALQTMIPANALTGVISPLHQGARLFWEEQGLIPSEAKR
ncbi:TAXI family TRAP transporter solute-binding subunit [Rhodocyclaceae bacterium SMB388]